MIYIYIFGNVILVLLLVIMWYSSKKKNLFIDRFTSKFEIISAMFLTIGIFLTYSIFYNQNKSMIRESTFNIIDRSWLGVNEKLVKYYDKCPHFIDSLYFDWQIKVMGTKSNVDVKEDWTSINFISNSIFQAWEDFITASEVDETGEIVWINNFLQWTQSSLLRNTWSVLKSNYAHTTQEFGDYLFYISSAYECHNEDELKSLAQTLVDSEKFKQIMKNRFS
jgi:hypothetical protein